MAPTRELAKQVEREFQQAAPGLKTGCYYGGASLPVPVACQLLALASLTGVPGQ